MKGPRQAALFVTSRCNQRCSYCATAPGRAAHHQDMDPLLVERLLLLFPTIRSVGIGGGEPLLNRKLPWIISTCLSHGLQVTLSTNGTLLRRASLPWRRLSIVNVSMTESNREAYRERCGVDAFGKALAGAKHARKAGATVVLSYVIERGNVGRIEEYALFTKEAGFRRIALQSICPTAGRYDEFWGRAIDGGDEELMGRIREAMSSVKSLGLIVTQSPQPVYRRKPGRGCRMACDHISVDGLGNVALCCRGPGPRPEMGNISQGASVWSTGAMEALRVRVLSGNPPVKCTMCKAYWRPR